MYFKNENKLIKYLKKNPDKAESKIGRNGKEEERE